MQMLIVKTGGVALKRVREGTDCMGRLVGALGMRLFWKSCRAGKLVIYHEMNGWAWERNKYDVSFEIFIY